MQFVFLLLLAFNAFGAWDVPTSTQDALFTCEKALVFNRTALYQLATMRVPLLEFESSNEAAVVRINTLLTPQEFESVETDWDEANQTGDLNRFHRRLAQKIERSAHANAVLRSEGNIIAYSSPRSISNVGFETAARAQMILNSEIFTSTGLPKNVRVGIGYLVNLTPVDLDVLRIRPELHRSFVESIANLEITRFPADRVLKLLSEMEIAFKTGGTEIHTLRSHLTSYALGRRYLKEFSSHQVTFEYRTRIPPNEGATAPEGLEALWESDVKAKNFITWLTKFGMAPEQIIAHLGCTSRVCRNDKTKLAYTPDIDVAVLNSQFNPDQPASADNPFFIVATQVKTVFLDTPERISYLPEIAKRAIAQLRPIPLSFAKRREAVIIMRGNINEFGPSFENVFKKLDKLAKHESIAIRLEFQTGSDSKEFLGTE